MNDLEVDCIFQRVCRWPSWDIFVLLGCVQTETQALMGLSKSHEGVFNKKHSLKGHPELPSDFQVLDSLKGQAAFRQEYLYKNIMTNPILKRDKNFVLSC